MPNRKTMTRLAGVLAAGIMACAGSAANAVVVFDNIDLTGQASTRIAASSPGALVSVAANITINQIAVRNDLNSNGNLKFLIFDHATHALLFNSGSTAFVDNGMSLKTSNPFSFTLLGGMSYDIGAIADVGGLWGFDQISNSQNGITSIVTNPNFSNFASPAQAGHAAADGHIQLIASPVSEPGTLAIMGLGLAGLGFARRRKLAA